MIGGETVTVLRPVEGGPDEMGEPAVEWSREDVPGCLWSQSYEQSAAISDGSRPDGVDDSATLHLPKAYPDSVQGCRVEAAGRLWDVIGDVVGYMPDNTPGAWNRSVKLRGVEG